jgi:putative ABC transport system permease protein
LVLLIACANMANLLLARAAARHREMAVRAALGAGRWRIVRQLLCESVLLSAIGGLVGLLFAQGSLRLIHAVGQNSLPRAAEIGLDARVLLLSGTVALLTGILFGLAPAWQASRPDLQATLKDAARGATGRRAGLRHGLVVAEVAVTLVLFVGAGLLLRSFYQLQRVNPGFAYERVLTFWVNLSEQKYPNADACEGFFRNLLERIRSLPGVEAASVASQIPLDTGSWDTSFLIEGRPEPPPYERSALEVHLVDPDYFRVMGIPLLRGRAFTERDNREHTRGTAREESWNAWLNVIIIDEEFARRHFPNENPIGKQIRIPWGPRETNPVLTIVGVVGRVKEEGLRQQGGRVQAYFSSLQRPSWGMAVQIRTASAPETLIAAARQQVLALDPELPIYDIRTLAAMRADNIAPERLNLALLGIFAGVALALAVIGLYGVLACAVAQRQREIGVRVALGAQRRDVLRLVVGQGMRLALLGIGIGLAAAFALSRVLQALLFEVQPSDPLTYATVPFMLAAVALLACWLPARRATKVDPLEALRYE